jgi:hypothetical protein|tara:strand:+ start:1228 stop:1467 length:240 start_codon:yes stop_codon:yes gene_type:complete
MEYNEYILIGLGIFISVIGYFLKRENRRLEELEILVNKINIVLAKNDVRDSERWNSINKRLEDRRMDIRKIYDILSNIK